MLYSIRIEFPVINNRFEGFESVNEHLQNQVLLRCFCSSRAIEKEHMRSFFARK